VRQIIEAPRREHSRKPDEQYARIEALVGGPYIELFARQAWPGWVAWGNQTEKFEVAA
jgi:N6-adenosine-specific RNA methylase IME4